MGTTTTNFGLYKPAVGEVGWGDLRNTSYDDIDTAMQTNLNHLSSDGSSHTFIDQNVTSGAAPTFDGANFTNIAVAAVDVSIADVGGIITATDVEEALQENRGIIDTNATHVAGDGSDHADVATNTTHSSGSGSDHADVATNTTHSTGDGSDHADVATNTLKVTNANHTGDATGDAALTLASQAVEGQTPATVASLDEILIADVDDSDNLKKVTAQSIADLGGGGGATLELDVTQANAFSVDEWVYHNGTTYELADASDAVTAESIGIITAATGADFTVQFGGRITGLTGLTAGEAHFLSETPGAITATAPTTAGAVVKPVLVADSTTTGFIFNMRGIEVASTSDTTVFRDTFTNSDLPVVTISHAIGNKIVMVQVFDENDDLVQPDDINLVDTNDVDIDLTSFGTISGTWNVVIIG